MTNLLVIYDRAAGQVLREEHFDRRRDALAARFSAEKEFRGRPDIEIVVLVAKSRSDLLSTHGRYFFPLDELIARIA
ncbi:hypothetical protein SAMN05421505_103103 [Sinosporangium album]|uniref:Uncharacterized protein n=1 Tax=Sinosporangium album TaxID=504805 RepID=A0A1G7T497_9ACTN|nr:hypothetical protein [Sinosporangium album]SDG30156.1 hypothetical protein SAMN05421505_103103 [Sinosporangium album]